MLPIFLILEEKASSNSDVAIQKDAENTVNRICTQTVRFMKNRKERETENNGIVIKVLLLNPYMGIEALDSYLSQGLHVSKYNDPNGN